MDKPNTPQRATPKQMAAELNACLAAGGTVRMWTAQRCTVYSKRHADWFFVGKDKCLRVRSGRSSLCLSLSNGTLLVALMQERAQ
jgi:hypothetical protein